MEYIADTRPHLRKWSMGTSTWDVQVLLATDLLILRVKEEGS
jgi:hypothetical protein